MTIPQLYRVLSERYPLINQKITGRVRPEFDNLYIDLNPILKKCCTESSYTNPTQIMCSIFGEICKIVQLIEPKKILYLSIDGVSPHAKHNAIRQQTFINAFNKLNRNDNRERLNEFDTNSILPGTEWIESLNKELELFIRRQITENSIWKRLTIIYDDYLCPEEASHKIMNWIRREKSSNDCDANIRHCLYGLDNNYFIMALALHEIHFCLMSDQLLFGTQYKERLYSDSKCMIDHDESFQLLHISILREYLNLEFDNKHNIENIVDDFVLLMILFENEYLPRIPSLDIEVLLESYKEILNDKQYMVEYGVINFNVLHRLLINLSGKEGILLTNMYQMLIRHYERLSMDITALNCDLKCLQNDYATYNTKYYSAHFENKNKENICCDYIMTLEWIMRYYYFGCVSWEWCYKYHYAPLLTDLANINVDKMRNNEFNLGAPLRPFQELMLVLPFESVQDLLPEYCFQFINDIKFEAFLSSSKAEGILMDTNYDLLCRKVLPLLPFIDICEFKQVLYDIECGKKQRFDKLPMTDKEEKRNTLLNERIFSYDREKATDKLQLFGPLSFGVFPDVVSCIRNKDVVSCKAVIRPLPGTHLIIPGFPSLSGTYFKYWWCIKQIGLSGFGFDSKYKTLIINVINENKHKEENAELIANKLCVYINWPYFIQAKLFYVETRTFIYEQYNKIKHTDGEMMNFDQRCLKISWHLLKLKGINVGVVDCLVHCYPLIAMYRHQSKSKIIKKWSNSYVSIPIQMIWTKDKLTNFNYFDSRFIDQKIDKKLELRMGRNVMYIGNEMSLLGTIGTVISQTRNGSISIAVTPHKKHINIKYKAKMSTNNNTKWYSLSDAAELLNIQKIVLKRIISIIFVIHKNKKIQIGLRLFNFKKGLIVPGLSRIHNSFINDESFSFFQKKRKIKRRKTRFFFEISSSALQIVMEYRSKFPGVFRVIQEKPSLITFGSHYFAPDQIPTNFNPYIVSRVVGVSPNGLSSNFQNILDSLQKNEHKKEEEEEEEHKKKKTAINAMSRLFSPRKARFPHDLDNPSSVTNKKSKWKPDLMDTEPIVHIKQKEQTIDGAILSIRDAFKAQIHAAAESNALNTQTHDDKKEDHHFDGGLRYVSQVHHWLNNKNITKLGLVDANSIVIPTEALPQIEAQINMLNQQETEEKKYIRLEKIPIHDVYAADPKVAWSPTPQRLWRLGNRCCSLRSDSSVPFGATGTVIGIHSSFLEIIMDKACICGTNLCHKVTDLKGVKLPYDNVLNITKSFHSYSHQDLIPITQFPQLSSSVATYSTYPTYNNRYNNYNNNRYNNYKGRRDNYHKRYSNNNTKYRNSNNKKNNHNKVEQQQQILSTDNRNRHRTSPIYGSVNQEQESPQLTTQQPMQLQQLQNFISQQPPYIPPDSYLMKK